MNIEIYTREGCVYCVRAKDLMKSRGMSYNEIALDGTIVTKATIEARLTEKGIDKKVSTIPQIFIEGEYVGGYVEFAEWLLANKL